MKNYGTIALTIEDSNDNDIIIENESSYYKKKIYNSMIGLILISISVLSVVIFAVYSSNSFNNSNSKSLAFISKYKDINSNDIRGSSHDDDDDNDDDTMNWTFLREGYSVLPYFDRDASDVVKYKFLDDYDAIIEPYTNTNFMLLENADTDEEASSTYRYSVCEKDNSDVCYKGEYASQNADKSTTVNVACSPYDEFDISISQVSSEGEVLRKATGSAVCMYVRREIRGLSDDDLDKTMDAMYTLWSVDEEEGQELYGENYHPASYFAAAHDFNAAQQDADHIHEGLGFLPQHIKLTNMFEVAVQAVDPSVALPYWDFTIDVSEDKTIYESVIFSSRTFGSISKPKDEYWGFTYANDKLEDTKIQDGRWKDLKAELNTRYPGLSNGFGYMRGPWNMNPSPYITRFSAYSPTLPSCSDYYGGLGLPGFIDFLESAPYGSHASTHGVIGAVWGCDKMDTLREQGIIKDEDSQLAICKKWGFYMKELYRANYLSPRTDCTVTDYTEEEGVDCGFTCNDDTYDYFIQELKSTIQGSYLSSDITEEGWETWRDFICEGDSSKIFVADHLESASPYDPSFWPIHPTQERLLQIKYMIGSFANEDWPTDSVNSYVCDKASCYESEYGNKDVYDGCCYGHYEYDQLLDFVNGDKDNGYGPTNHEILKGTNPTNSDYSMTYIYDDFDWDHCEEDFDSLIESTFSTSENVFSLPEVEPTAKPTAKPTVEPTLRDKTRAPTGSDKSSSRGSSKSKGKSKSKNKSK